MTIKTFIKNPPIRYAAWMNLVLYQSIWFGSIFLQSSFEPVAITLLLLHFWLVPERSRELAVILICGGLGFTTDAALTQLGVYAYSPEPNLIVAPLWLAMIWFGFAGTVRHGLSFFMKRPWLAIPAGAIVAPLNYVGAERFGAVSYPIGTMPTAIIVSLAWTVLMAIFVITYAGFERTKTTVNRSAPSQPYGVQNA